MTLETIRNNIDTKIKKMYGEGRTLTEIKVNLSGTTINFKTLLETHTIGTPSNKMITMYIEQAEKRIKDLDFINDAYIKLNINNQ